MWWEVKVQGGLERERERESSGCVMIRLKIALSYYSATTHQNHHDIPTYLYINIYNCYV